MAPNPNIKKAFKAMKDLGIEESMVKPVLKKLLITYDKNWTLIAEDNFRTLADAIFEEQEAMVTQEEKGKNKKIEGEASPCAVEVNRGKKKAPEPEEEDEDTMDEPVLHLKRQRRRIEGSSAHTLSINSIPNLDVPVIKEEQPPLSLPAEKVPVPAVIIPKDEPFTDDMPFDYTHPGCSLVPVLDAGKSNGNGNAVPPQEHNGESNKAPPDVEISSEHKLVEVSEESSAMELASSPSGEVKINLNFIPSTGGNNFRLPSMDDLRIAMEEKCLRSYKILDPNFSVANFLNDMCSCYLELATNSDNNSPENFPYITSNLDILKQSPARHTLFSGVNEEPILGGLRGAEDSDSRGLVIVPECQISADDWRSVNCFNDITQGEEIIEIPWVNEVNDELLPPFRYIVQSIVYKNASVKFTLSNIGDDQCCSMCIRDCLTSPTPCACASADSGFAYSLEGLLKEDFLEESISVARYLLNQSLQTCKVCPLNKAKKEEIVEQCKGHLKRKAIKECWSKCGCDTCCGNRVVQRHIHKKLQVFFTPDGKGWGLRTLEKLAKGTFVCEFAGEILTIAELSHRVSEKLSSVAILDAYWGSEDVSGEDNALCLDGTRYGNVSRFINHRCRDANLIEIPVHVETPDCHYYHLAFFTTREIDAMEELTWDYGIDFSKNDDYPLKRFQCLCGSKFCRNMKQTNKEGMNCT